MSVIKSRKLLAVLLAVLGVVFVTQASEAQSAVSDIEIRGPQGTLCYGQIVSPDVVIVEAHCIIGQAVSSLELVAGGSNLAEQQRVQPTTYVIHNAYNPTLLTNDIAVLLLASPLSFTANVQPLASVETSRFPMHVVWVCSESGACATSGCAPGDAFVSVFPNGPIYDSTPQDLCTGNLGSYDSNTGAFTASNYDTSRSAFILTGKYLSTDLQSLPPTLGRFQSSTNDFRISPTGDSSANARSSTLWSSEAHLYYFINRYRSEKLTDAFINSLSLGAAEAANLLFRQYRPTLQGIVNARLPYVYANEVSAATVASSSVAQNDLFLSVRPRVAATDPLDSLAMDPGYVIGLYTGVLSNWITAGTAQWVSDPTWGNIGNTSWQSDIRPAILEGFKLWNGYRFTGKTELNRYAMLALRRWAATTCSTPSTPDCDKGWNIDNAMMYLDTADPALNNPSNPNWPASNSDDTLLFPYKVRSGVGTNHFGPQNGSLGGMFVAAIFYDISLEVGLGDEKADLLFWKTMSLIDPSQVISMTTFGQMIQQAARALWPSSTAGQSWYEQDLVDVLTSRGLRMNGVTNFVNNLPPALGTASNPGPGSLVTTSTSGVGSSIPESQRNSTTGYNFLSFFSNTYNVTAPNTQYVTYQFYKHSKYGACDGLDLTNGTINTVSSSNPIMNFDGSMSTTYRGRKLGNMVLLAPGSSLTFLRRRQSCVSENEGYYAEDVRPLGFRAIKATPNGFTLSAQRTGMANGRVTYQIDIVDPSLTLSGANTGPATYNWTFTEYNGLTVQFSGQQVSYSALVNQPFTLSVDRIRGTQTDNITLRERGNDFDREGGRQFNQNYWDLGYPVGFDTIVGRRLVEGHGSYTSALNPVGGAFGVQARRWTTPNQLVQPLRMTIVSHGLPSGSNPGPYHFENALYYNICIWGAQANVTASPGCHTAPLLNDYEHQVLFPQTGIDLLKPFAIVTASALPAYKWTIELPSSWRLQPNTEYYFGGHISASVVSNGYSYNVCSYAQATGTAGNPNDKSDWLAGANWSGQSGAPSPQTMKSYIANYPSQAVSNCTFSAYKFEGITVAP